MIKETMDIEQYLRRIHYQGPIEPNQETLFALHQAHMLAVPFENLDIPLGRPIVLDEARLFDKIVGRRRGGFCYELNGLFSALLRELGFPVQRLSARVANADGGFGIEFDHMALLVQLEQRWLADVGFGDSFLEPLLLDERGIQSQPRGRYQLLEQGDHLAFLEEENSGIEVCYIFSLQPHTLEDFAGACFYHQTSPESSFTHRRVCSRATPEGRITLSDGKLILTSNGTRRERALENESELPEILAEYFGVVL